MRAASPDHKALRAWSGNCTSWRSPARRGTPPPEAIPAPGSSGTSAACPSGRRAGRRLRRLCSRRRRPGSTTPPAGTATRRLSLVMGAHRGRRRGRSRPLPSRCCRPAAASGSIHPISSTSHVRTREIEALSIRACLIMGSPLE